LILYLPYNWRYDMLLLAQLTDSRKRIFVLALLSFAALC